LVITQEAHVLPAFILVIDVATAQQLIAKYQREVVEVEPRPNIRESNRVVVV